MSNTSINFPNIGIFLPDVGRSVMIGNIEIMYYGIIITIGVILGYLVAAKEAKRTNQNPEIYMDYLMYAIIPAIIGARLYYVIFSWDYYSKHLGSIVNIREGGLGIVGGVICAMIVLAIFSHKRKIKASLMLDTICMGILTGQIMGRWGNFFNREAFGCFTGGPLAMQIPVSYFENSGRLNEIASTGLLEKVISVSMNGQTVSCIQVHPTFLYEGLWNLALLCFIFCYKKRKKFDGEMFCIYLIGYGIGRFFIESLRVDQLQIGHTGIAATQIVCIAIILGGLATIVYQRWRIAKAK